MGKNKIPNATRKDFEAHIKAIGWSIKESNNGLNDVLVTPSGKVSDWRVMDEGIEPYSNQLFGNESFVCKVIFYFSSLSIIDNSTVSLGGEGGFVLFMNHA